VNRSSLGLGVFFLLLASCAQVPQKAANNTSQEIEGAPKQQLIIKYLPYLPPTHPAAQDITYNSHYPPHFPVEAIRAGHYGTVTLLIYVGAKGEIGEIRVEQSSGYPELDASAVDAARQWNYLPEAKDGVPQPGWIRIPVNFGRPVPAPPSPNS